MVHTPGDEPPKDDTLKGSGTTSPKATDLGEEPGTQPGAEHSAEEN